MSLISRLNDFDAAGMAVALVAVIEQYADILWIVADAAHHT